VPYLTLCQFVGGFSLYLTENALYLLKPFREHIFDTLRRKQNHAFAPAHPIWQSLAFCGKSEFGAHIFGAPLKVHRREKTDRLVGGFSLYLTARIFVSTKRLA